MTRGRRATRPAAIAALALAAAFAVAAPARAVAPSDRYASKPGPGGIAYESVTFPSDRDSVPLVGWWFEGPKGSPVLVLFDRGHGNMGDLLGAVREFAARGFTVMTFDYREFGPGGPGEADTLRTLAFASRWVNDAVGALRYARSRAGGRYVFAWGQDLGGWTALAAAARDHRLADAVAVEGLFRTTMELLYRNGTSQLPDVASRHRQLVEGPDEPMAAVARLLVPLHVVIAGKDEVTPPAWTREVTRASLSRIDRWVLPEAGHDGAELSPGYWDHMADWYRGIAKALDQVPKTP